MLKRFNVKTKEKGVTLVELLVAVAAFGIFIGAISGLLVSAIQAQRRILNHQELFTQASYVLEYIGRALRMVLKDQSGDCLGVANQNFSLEPEGLGVPGIRFLKSTESGNICQEFYFGSYDNGTPPDPSDDFITLLEKKSTDGTAASFDNPYPLISKKFQVDSVVFDISGDIPSESPNLQPRVTIFLDLLGPTSSAGQPKVRVQTSISQRSLDAEF